MKLPKKQALIVDPSAKENGGHYLEFAKRMADIFESDHDVTILSSKYLRGQFSQSNTRIIPTFTYGYWDLPFKGQAIRKLFLRMHPFRSFRLRVRLKLSVVLFFNSSGKIRRLFLVINVPLLLLISYIRAKFPTNWLNFSSILSSKRIFPRANITGYGSPPFEVRLKGRRFRKELTSHINSSTLKPNVLFCGTITAIEMYELTNLSQKYQSLERIILVLRREPHEEGLSRQFWLALGKRLESNVFQLFADTEPLAKLWEITLEIPVEIFPIPTWSDDDISRANYVDAGLVTYLGDARNEKNFDEFCGLVPSLLETKHLITAQINYHESRELSVEPFRNSIKHRKNTLINLIEEPLSSEKYRETLFSSSLIYTNYDPLNYAYRSSGVFVEAVTASKPVMVSDGSWMHYELNKLSIPYWEELFVSNSSAHMSLPTLINTSNLLLKFQCKAKSKKIQFNVDLNTGIALECSCWTDKNGTGYFVLPTLGDSEYITAVSSPNLLGSSIEFDSVGFDSLAPKFVGGVVVYKNRAIQAFNEFHSKQKEYLQFSLLRTSDFKKFHSYSKLNKIIHGELAK